MPHVLLLDPDVVSRASLCQRIERVQLRQQRRPPNLPSRPLARNGSERRARDIMIETEQRRDGGPRAHWKGRSHVASWSRMACDCG
eukprot:CAMPEP_0181189080 /NCGR_PEP_ID=MMETSP1096-20121128/11469_1 /TAXON_ID=156174 ORGANISM="Chrysochromulina ericina, Strain CCMP281" /NCGR_SAMPLE_ID=MMETSP1096 /ASSEMBLY_ACC=CAM_ASM_000453 /LENGTH=85 /DNA_ID=CAMNT_0023278205 /DNA_START=481 /DNA_END=735 /DNA_ORIENTATION=-